MRPLVYRTCMLVWLLLTAALAHAQKDTAKVVDLLLSPVAEQKKPLDNKLYVVTDSVATTATMLKFENGKAYIVNDTVPHYKTRARLVQKSDSLFRRTDSLRRKNDSLYKKSAAFKRMSDSLYRKKDSLFKKSMSFKKVNDSLFRKHDLLFRKSDSLFKKSLSFKRVNDSLFRKNQVYLKAAQRAKKINDSLFRSQYTHFKKYSGQFRKQTYRLNSLDKLNWKKDTTRLKLRLKVLESNLQRLKTDSLKILRSKQKKLITREVDCNENGHLSIDNIGRRLVIKTISGNKIKLETVLLFEEGTAVKEVSWEKDFNIAVTGDPNSVVIRRAGGENKAPATAQSPAPASFKSPLTIYVPAFVKINIEHRYNDLVIMNDLVKVKLNLVNTNLSMQNAEEATIKSKYGSVKAGIIKIADLDLLNCTFSSVMMEKMLINSKYSNINVKNAGLVTMKSFSDQYKFDKAKDIIGSKSFGQFNIVQLDNSITLNGSSADLTINKIDSAAKTIKVDNKYADVKLPAEKLQNYSLQFNGTHSNVFTSFDKIKTGATDSVKASNPGFIKTMGDLKKDFTELVVKCSSCSVDFR